MAVDAAKTPYIDAVRKDMKERYEGFTDSIMSFACIYNVLELIEIELRKLANELSAPYNRKENEHDEQHKKQNPQSSWRYTLIFDASVRYDRERKAKSGHRKIRAQNCITLAQR
jgi:hypothetical protein